jgi:hypothetical protein
MYKLMASLLLAASISLPFFGCSDKNSKEACQYAVTMNLDRGNYDAVLASSCTDSMQRGAAYLGKAGFSMTNVINAFSRTGSGGSSQSDLKIYMTHLIGRVDESTFTALDNSRMEYGSIPPTADVYKDALFNLGIADVVKSLSLLKIVLDAGGSGTISTACDRNSNTKPDEIDASGCAFETSAGVSCTTANTTLTTDSSNILISNATNTAQIYAGTYRGLVISVTGTGTDISSCPTSTQYSYLLYQQSAGPPAIWAPAPSAGGPTACLGSDGLPWPCPIIQNNQPIDLVTTFDSSLTSGINEINTALTTTVTDVQTAVDNIKTDACPSGTCTPADLAGYLQTY